MGLFPNEIYIGLRIRYRLYVWIRIRLGKWIDFHWLRHRILILEFIFELILELFLLELLFV